MKNFFHLSYEARGWSILHSWPIVNFMADLAEISIHDVVTDFACGSGGFLIKAFEQMKRGVEELPTELFDVWARRRPSFLTT